MFPSLALNYMYHSLDRTFLSSFVKIQNLHSSLSQLEVYQLFILLVVDAKSYVQQNHDPKTRNEQQGIVILGNFLS